MGFQNPPLGTTRKRPSRNDALWAFEHLPMLYDLAFSFEARHMPDAYRLAAELCHELDRIYATSDYEKPPRR